MPIAFYCRAKPQECEAFRIFQQARRVFLGWPLVREELAYDRRRLCACIVDPRSASDDEWEREAAGYSPAAQRQFSKNRNFVRRVEKHRQDGAIVLVPRPAEGLAYLARLTSPFEVVDAPWWGECYLRLRASALRASITTTRRTITSPTLHKAGVSMVAIIQLRFRAFLAGFGAR